MESTQKRRVSAFVLYHPQRPFAHLHGCFVGKGERERIGRIYSDFTDEICQSACERLGLPASGTRKDK